VRTIFAAADRRLVAGILVSAGFLLVVVFLVASSLSAGRRRGQVPAALRPGPSDEELENRTLPRFLASSAVFLLFMSVFIPAYWLREPTRIELKAEQFKKASIHRGQIIYEPAEPGAAHFSANCARCHGLEGEGAVQPFKEIYRVAEPPLKYIVARYKAAGRNDDEIKQILYDAIERGRPGTLMPTWGLAFGGPLNAEQVDDVVNFILSEEFQEELPEAAAGATGAQLFETNCSTCHTTPPYEILGPGGTKTDPPTMFTSPIAGGGYGPDLRSVFSQLTADEIFKTIHDGRLNTNRPSMPSWAYLGDQAIRKIMDFLRTLQIAPTKVLPPSPAPATATAAASPSPTGGAQ
jgi:mono/diheme cytochrome c family protein